MKQKKVIKLTESDLRRIISEKLEGDMSEGPGLLGSLINRATFLMSYSTPSTSNMFVQICLATSGIDGGFKI